MIRRDFIQRLTVAGATGLGPVALRAENAAEVSFRVTGFTCVTCAVGLEVMLSKEPGVIRARASYPDRNVNIRFDAAKTNPRTLQEFINKTTGFQVDTNESSQLSPGKGE